MPVFVRSSRREAWGWRAHNTENKFANFLASGVGLDRTVNRDVFPTLDLEVFQEFARDFPRLLEEIASGEFESYADVLAKFISSQFNSNGIVVLRRPTIFLPLRGFHVRWQCL